MFDKYNERSTGSVGGVENFQRSCWGQQESFEAAEALSTFTLLLPSLIFLWIYNYMKIAEL
jgi:hypothetical protein